MILLELQDIADILENIIDFFQVIIQFVNNTFKGLATAFGYIVAIVPKALTLIYTLPSWLIIFAQITISVSVAYLIIHRDTGKSR